MIGTLIGTIWLVLAVISFINNYSNKREDWEIPVYSQVIIANIYFATNLTN